MKHHRRFFALMLAGVVLLVFALPALAADSTWRMTHGDDWQDALLVGEVIEAEVGSNYVIFDVVRTVNGKPAKSPFRLETGDGAPFERKYSPGDGILASVCYDQSNRATGFIAYGAFKVELMQDKKIKMDACFSDVGFIEWYVNTGENDLYYGMGSSTYRRTEDGEGQLLFDGETWYLNSLDPKYRAPEVTREPIEPLVKSLIKDIPLERVLKIAAFGFGFGVLAGAGVVLLIVLLRRRRSQNQTHQGGPQ